MLRTGHQRRASANVCAGPPQTKTLGAARQMWKAATIVFAIAGIATPVVIEVLRAIIHRHRERHHGIGGTQDIAMWGTIAALGFWFGAAVCGIAWFLTK